MESTIMAFGGLVLGWTLERLQRHYRDRWQERRRRLRLRRLIGPRDE
jgi:hypothetical protein